MLRNLSGYDGYSIGAKDRELGKVRDFYFDDRYWVVRYVVVDTGTWLPGRKVLISPRAIEHSDVEAKTLHVSLTAEQVKDSPPIETDKPVSREVEGKLSEYFGWPIAYWSSSRVTQPEAAQAEHEITGEAEDDSNIRSSKAVTGYGVEALDGAIGYVDDFIIEDDGWGIRYMAVDTRKWLPGRKVLVAPQWIYSVSWAEMKVHVDLSREGVKDGPQYDPSAPVNREYETHLYDYYGRPKYWV